MQNVVFPVIPGEHVVYGPPQGQWTEHDWEQLPGDGNRYEIINGVLYMSVGAGEEMSTAPGYFHQYIIFQLVRLVGIPAFEQGIAHVIFAPVGLFMPACDPVQPDLVIIRRENEAIIRDKRIRGVPDMLVEVLSPGNAEYDENTKLNAYANAGVPEYAVIDPAAKQLRLYRLIEPGKYDDPERFNADAVVTFGCLPGIQLQVGQLFEGSPDTTL
jgi:Uma2 family endonuclease